MEKHYLSDRNLTMLTDFYELTMANGYFANGKADEIAYFDMFFRKVPDGGGFAIFSGLCQLIEYLKNLKFTKDDLEYLRKKGFKEDFIKYLENFKFSCDVWSVDEGTPIFPGEPIVTVKGPIIQAQLIETMLLLCINHSSLVATKANRIVRAAEGRNVVEGGARRAHSFDAAVYSARAAYIAGCKSSSNTIADCLFGVPAAGTMAHSWIQSFPSEYEAFKAYAEEYPSECIMLVDTYNTLRSGVPNAIKVFNEVLVPKGYRPKGIRIDSGDITYLSKKSRKMLDEAGFSDCQIVASNSIDEFIIRDMLIQGAKVDTFLVGERLVTAKSDPVFGGVYKLCALEKDGVITPKMKISENVSKITNPCPKKLWRLLDRDTGKAIADVITLLDEVIDDNAPYEVFDPEYPWKRKTVENFIARPLLKRIFKGGECVYKIPSIKETRKYCLKQIDTLWEEVVRFENPHKYYVDLSQKLWDERQKMLSENLDKFKTKAKN